MNEPHYIVLSTRLTDDQLAAIDRIAGARGQTRAATIRWLVADAINRFFMPAGLNTSPDGPSDSKSEAAE